MSRSVQLPNGQRVWCGYAPEALLTYDEVQEYFDQGLEVGPGQVVVDIGANIGLFSLAISERSKGKAKIFAFEPIPRTFELLRQNVQSYPNIQPIQKGLADQPGRLRFFHYPFSTASSTAFPDTDHQAQVDRSIFWLKSMPSLAKYRWLLRFPQPIVRLQHSLSVRFQSRGKPIVCEVETLSQFLRKHHLDRIDLLKVDAEKAEVPILKGIADADWPKLHQMILEVHDLDHDLPWIQQHLAERGFEVTHFYYGYGSKESGMATLYARNRNFLYKSV